MNHRAVFGVAVAVSIGACAGKTTSLGGPDAEKVSASAMAGDAAPDVGVAVQFEDAAGPASNCHWYSWGPVATSVPCEYLLPSPAPYDPDFDPKTWDPHHVRVEFGAKQLGPYVETLDGCNGADGWYYADADGQAPTKFMICPATCAFVDSEAGAGFIAIAAVSCQ